MLLSIMGLYEYDNTVFDGLNLPDYTDDSGVVYSIDREALINNILLKCAELEVIYPRIETMKMAITAWSVANQNVWKKLLLTEYVNYNPIWNVDANISETEQRDISRNGTGSINRSINSTDTESVKGFNSNEWADSKKNTVAGTDNTGTSDTETVDDDVVRTQRRTGNIGVTATQDLIEKERAVAEFSIINYITMSFKNEFCILIY